MRLGAQLLICAVIATVPALTLGSIALDHNPQGEFANPGYTSNLFRLVGLSWALFALPTMAVVTLIDWGRRSRD